MAALSYMQRRASGTYEFRKRLPEALAGKPVPSHMRDAFPPERACPPRESLLPVHVVRGCAQPAGPEKAVLPDARLAPG